MSFTENSVIPLSFDALNLHKVVATASALYVERNHAFAVLTLYASALFDTTYDALETKPLMIDLIQPYWGFRSHCRSRDPH
jgi:hypothetical protein